MIREALICAEDSHTEHRAKRALVGFVGHGGEEVAARCA